MKKEFAERLEDVHAVLESSMKDLEAMLEQVHGSKHEKLREAFKVFKANHKRQMTAIEKKLS